MAPPYKLCHVQGKVVGLFATETIKRGTRIIEEAPLLYLTPHERLNESREVSRKVDQLPAFDAQVFDGLHCDAGALDDVNNRYLLEYYKEAMTQARRMAQSTSDAIEEDALNASVEQTSATAIRSLAIFLTNATEMEAGAGTGVFTIYSRMNHACSPNTSRRFNGKLGKLTVHTVRQITKGEELTTTYIATPARIRKRQRAVRLKKGRGFNCTCRTCTGPKAANSGQRRAKMQKLDERLDRYEDEQASKRESASERQEDAKEALRIAKEILTLLHDEGLMNC